MVDLLQTNRTADQHLAQCPRLLKEEKQVPEVYDEVVEQQGGLLIVKSLGCIPKGRQEISNVKRAVVRETTELRKDEMVGLVELGKEENFIRRVTLIPEAMCVLANNRQLDDMKKFLIEEGNSVIMGVDCTFYLGPFLATVTTYRHPMLRDCKSRRSAVMMGPILLYVKRTEQSYAYLGEVLASIFPELANIQWIGTDREGNF